jgi:hypothetical protein
MTTTVTGLLCWRDSHPLEWQLASLHGHFETKSDAYRWASIGLILLQELPASHTIEIVFMLPPDFPHGGISSVPGLLMKQSETTRGVPLNGVAIKSANNLFLIGLSNVDADMRRNAQLMTERTWLDVPIVYSDGTRAILAVEKASWGERALAVLDLAAVEPTPTRQPAEMPRVPLDAALTYAALSSAQSPQIALHDSVLNAGSHDGNTTTCSKPCSSVSI